MSSHTLNVLVAGDGRAAFLYDARLTSVLIDRDNRRTTRIRRGSHIETYSNLRDAAQAWYHEHDHLAHWYFENSGREYPVDPNSFFVDMLDEFDQVIGPLPTYELALMVERSYLTECGLGLCSDGDTASCKNVTETQYAPCV